MNKIIELEALRGFAAIYVVLHHTLSVFFPSNLLLNYLFKFGQEAVMVFFLLSGYVIAMSLDKKHYTFKEYFIHRFLRIYTVFIFAIILSGLMYFYINPSAIFDIKQLFLNIMMMQDHSGMKPGTFVDPIFNNNPLWSLSYEWWFYMIYFFHFKFLQINPEKKELFLGIAFIISLIGLLSYKITYNQISLFLMYYYIWFSGAYSYFIFHSTSNRNKKLLFLIFGYVFLITIYAYLFIFHEKIHHLVDHPILELRHYLASLVLLLFAIVVVLYVYNKLRSISLYLRIRDFFAYFAPISFGLYVIHYPIKNILSEFEWNGWIKLFCTLLVSIILSYISEIIIFRKIKKFTFFILKG